MSMNLTCEGVELWQTPTHITWMCLSYDPVSGEPDGGHDAVRRRYILWVESSLNGTWHDADDLSWQRDRVKEHVKMIKAIKNPKFSFI